MTAQPIPVVAFNFVAQSVRIIMRDDEPWFVAADVCDALTIANSRDAVSKLDDDERADVGITDISSNGITQGRNVTIINESGLYSLILTSRKPEAKKFKKWVTSEVLPAIRKTGRYVAPQAVMPQLVSSSQIDQMSTKIWVMGRAFYMEESVKHWLFKYSCALAGVTRRDHIPAAMHPEVIAFLNAISVAVDAYRHERIRHEKEWLLLTLKRELDKRLGRAGPEFEMLAAPAHH